MYGLLFLLFLEIQGQKKVSSTVMSFALRFLFQQSCVAQHLFARRRAEFFQNIVVVEFERTFAYIKYIGDLLCGFALQIEVKNGFSVFVNSFNPILNAS